MRRSSLRRRSEGLSDAPEFESGLRDGPGFEGAEVWEEDDERS